MPICFHFHIYSIFILGSLVTWFNFIQDIWGFLMPYMCLNVCPWDGVSFQSHNMNNVLLITTCYHKCSLNHILGCINLHQLGIRALALWFCEPRIIYVGKRLESYPNMKVGCCWNFRPASCWFPALSSIDHISFVLCSFSLFFISLRSSLNLVYMI